jgi:hypothetical protein
VNTIKDEVPKKGAIEAIAAAGYIPDSVTLK